MAESHVPIVTDHAPQTKYCRNIIVESFRRVLGITLRPPWRENEPIAGEAKPDPDDHRELPLQVLEQRREENRNDGNCNRGVLPILKQSTTKQLQF